MKIITLLVASVTLLSCASGVNYGRQSLTLEIGMTKAYVLSVLDEPKRTDVNLDREKWVYWNAKLYGFTPIDSEVLAEDKLMLVFEDGRLSKWGKGADLGDIIETSQEMQKALIEYYKPPDK